jgi:DNA-directed RNA polymerase specialized sigma24 family protein
MFNLILRKRARIAYWRSIACRCLAGPQHEVDPAHLERFRAAIDSMPALTREVFELHRFDDLPYGRIAARLGIGVDEVEAQLVAALTHLSLAVDGDC